MLVQQPERFSALLPERGTDGTEIFSGAAESEPLAASADNHPFTAPSMIPFTKYRCMKGYTSRIGMMLTMETV